MNRYQKNRRNVVTVSAKIDEKLRNKLDEIKNNLNLKNRSEVVRLAIESFISNQ